MGDRPPAHVFALPPGVDFPDALIRGVLDRFGDDPLALAEVELFVNTQRMRRRLTALLDAGPARLLPRIRLITELGAQTPVPDLDPPVNPLRRRLELASLIRGLIAADPTLAPRSAAFALADSLLALMDEMRGEGLSLSALQALDLPDVAGHWQRSLAFIAVVQRYFETDSAPDTEQRQRRAVEHIAAQWRHNPPSHPVIVAGSTGSRGATAMFMEAVACLPRGAVVLPGFDTTMGAAEWARLADAPLGEDHPQYRFARFLTRIGLEPDQVRPWQSDNPRAQRNQILSLALRPAPVTHQWMTEGPALPDPRTALAAVDLVEAPTVRSEALTIAWRMRAAVDAGQRAALISPDRDLTRRVAAALDRWGILPDDSAGRPLALTPPGRFLRQVAAMARPNLPLDALIAVLKHPLCASGQDRGTHLRHTRDLELWLRDNAVAYPDDASLDGWSKDTPERRAYAVWLKTALVLATPLGEAELCDHINAIKHRVTHLARGLDPDGAGALWDKAAGEAAQLAMETLEEQADASSPLTDTDVITLVHDVLARGEVREPLLAHPGVMIWGTLEARVQGADLVILGGLNEGSWPTPPSPDPWLNRAMRAEVGLLLPERQIGLSAHDFQQAFAASYVVMTRALRGAESETVPARWLARLTGLLAGLEKTGGAEALADMRARGDGWCAAAMAFDSTVITSPQATRPAPQPPVAHRPRRLSVTQVQRLIRDPYAIYARNILRLKPLNPLRPTPDYLLRGTVIHKVLERFLTEGGLDAGIDRRQALMVAAADVLESEVPWPVERRLWLARIARFSDWLLRVEAGRPARSQPPLVEKSGVMVLTTPPFSLSAKADRIDVLEDGQLEVLDYKTGSPPSKAVIEHFDKQLLLEAIMAARGDFEDVPAGRISAAHYVGLGATPKIESLVPSPDDLADGLAGFIHLISAFNDRNRGYAARRAVARVVFGGDYDHLARFGEWADSDAPVAEEVG